MAIQHRRGVFDRFVKSKLLPGEWAIVQSGDPNTKDGSSAYICTAANKVKRVVTDEEAAQLRYDVRDDVLAEISQTVDGASQAAAEARAQAAEAQTAANDAKDATTRANAAIDAMGDISELAVPLMTKDTRGGAKLGNSLQLVDERLNVKLTGGGSGRSVATESAEALAALTVHGESIQDGTPTPDAPVPVQVMQGRNLATTEVYRAGYTIDANGNEQASSNYSIFASIPIDASKTYRIVGVRGANNTNDSIRINYFGENGFISRQVLMNSVLTIPSDAKYIRLVYGVVEEATSYVYNVQLTEGETVYKYVPYGSIGILIGDTVTPIDLQGNVLASLPDGTHDRLLVDSAGHMIIDNTVGYTRLDGTANWETVSSGVNQQRLTNFPNAANATNTTLLCTHAVRRSNASETGSITIYNNTIYINLGFATAEELKAYLTNNPVYIVYKLATPQLIDLGYIDMPTIESGDAISVSASIVPVIDATWWERGAGAVADAIKAISTRMKNIEAALAALATS